MTKNVRMNPDGFDKLMAEISAKLQKVDADIRSEYTGQPAETVATHASEAFTSAGVSLTESDIEAYSRSVEEGKPFKIELK